MIKPDTINIIISGMQRLWIIDLFTSNCNKYITIIFPLPNWIPFTSMPFHHKAQIKNYNKIYYFGTDMIIKKRQC